MKELLICAIVLAGLYSLSKDPVANIGPAEKRTLEWIIAR